MVSKKKWRIQRLKVSVAVPIASLDRRGRRLSSFRVKAAADLAMDAMTGYFGGATAMPAMGTWRDESGSVMHDKRQRVVVSMTTPSRLKRRRMQLEALADRIARFLDQEAVAVIVSRAETRGFLLFPNEESPCQES